MSLNERYNILHKKLRDLESVHEEGKRTHQVELDDLKSELARYRKTVSNQSDRIEKYKKQNDSLEPRMLELKKAAQADQTEIKSLKAKLRAAEHENAQLVSKYTDIAEVKKNAQCLESKHHDELRERDRRIAELEKNAVFSSSKCQTLESKLRDLKLKGDADSENTRSGTKQLESQLVNARQELLETRKQVAAKEETFAEEREDFLDRLTRRDHLLSFAAQQYARLLANTVPLSDHLKLKRMYTAGQLNILRLERKLGNAEDQITELAHLIRQSNHSNDLLREHLRDALHQATVYEDMLKPTTPAGTVADHSDLQLELSTTFTSAHHQDITAAQLHLCELLVNYCIIRSQQLFFAYTCVEKELAETSKLASKHSRDLASALASHKTISANLESAEKDRSSLTEQIQNLTKARASLQQANTSLKDQNDLLHNQQRQSVLIHEAAVKKDKNEIQRLTSTVQKSRVAEDALRAEIDRLLTELADAERYQEAYTSLCEEVGALVARNQLAEEEAEHLSKFNAEILGHNNPAQRISYVDRIRRELAEAKLKIVMLSREQEAVVGLNADIQHELDMYKSMDKPGTHITRVQRAPLTNVTRNLNVSNKQMPTKTIGQDVDLVPGDMTMDEII
ncbi:hypothetical protein AGABI2DRAFT_204453 [Agaricus bisporus var. bisporus H97]|uniref:hypothetical protein n=1 Tax=Agaricus bisporus var. bisporus (strain H97 / ATCC MYA-4626 / FGSC 10389) TaxID=936046 RepID=UPI00029F5F21|nr:hypothetical protein AGABI2DRAFT_204453 [Agaricus bisporus var. bisporus H97]EKV47390.1 hypothetical protein AGABI2DRAFT_204453 [Agaricus bisporus var. bisporus H97]